MTVREMILCDFDGTITESETMELIYSRFAACGLKYARMWSQGLISTIEELTATFAEIEAPPAEMEAVFDELALTPGAIEFLQGCQAKGTPVAIVSDGLRWYINHVLARHNIRDMRIYANGIYHEPDGYKFSWTWYDPAAPHRSNSKANIIRRYQRRGYHVTFIGNGESDAEVVGVADRLCARSWLVGECERRGEPCIPFTDFFDLMGVLGMGLQ